MDNHYKTLGISQNASLAQIRRAYRILARRYHPDVNPSVPHSNSPDPSGNKDTTDHFRKVAEAYSVLSDEAQRKKYDDFLNYDSVRAQAFQAYERARSMRAESSAKVNSQKAKPEERKEEPVPKKSSSLWSTITAKISGKKTLKVKIPASVNIVELPITFEESAFGCKKTLNLGEHSSPISLSVPKATKDGSLLRSMHQGHEYLCIIRVSKHPKLSLQPRGLVADLPVTIREALLGAIIKAPGVQEENEITVIPGSQSGAEIRLDKKGLLLENGERGDLLYRLIITLPTCYSAVGISQAVEALEAYREEAPRQNIGTRLLPQEVA